MASVIRLRRKKNGSDKALTSVELLSGEPFYDAEKKNLYVGNIDNEVISDSKKHIAQIEKMEVTNRPDIVKFQIGEDDQNVLEHTVNNVEVAKSLHLKNDQYGKSLPTGEPHVAGRVFFVELTD